MESCAAQQNRSYVYQRFCGGTRRDTAKLVQESLNQMAEIAVKLVVDKLIPLLTEEAKFLRGVHREVEGIKGELQSIQAFLKDADRRADAEGDNINNGIKVLVKDLTEAAFDIECVIDKYTHQVAQRRGQQQEQRSTRLKFILFLRKVSCFITKLKPRHNIASEIKDLRQRVRDINQRSVEYGFNSPQQGSSSANAQMSTWSDPREASRFLKETEVVGRQADREELIGRLKGGSPERNVISLVGMPGIGKTTLANQLYNQVKGNFDCHAWIDVSQSYNKMDLLRNLLRKFCQSLKESIPEGIDAMDHYTLTTYLREYLQEKSYVVMFDDVWNTNFWADIEFSFPTGDVKSGRIVITTRKVEVANFCTKSSSVHVHELKLLSFENSWELFCGKVFHSQLEKACPANLKELSEEFVKRCDGLPLAIVVIGGLLATKPKTEDEWRKLLSSLSSELERNEHLKSITKILAFSYSDLPYYLKPCFLYLGIFPEDYSVRSRRLIRQWIAERFVQKIEGKTLETVAEGYLVELINRSMVQVSEEDFGGKARSCRIHDLLREFILKKMEDLNFCKLLSNSHSNFRTTAHRISIFRNSQDDCGSNCSPEISRARSVFVFDKEEMANLLVSSITTNFRLLKVLDFEDAPSLDHLPEDIGNLFHLQYLSVRGTRVKLLPKSIGKLENLETLDLKQSLVHEIPAEIKGLRKLQYLSAYHRDYKVDYHINRQRGVKIEKGIGQLKSLKKLFYIDSNIVEFDVFKEIGELTELEKLGILKLKSEQSTGLCSCIQKLIHLESVEINSISEDETIDYESVSSPPKFLQRLCLGGRLRKFPEWITKLTSLTRFTIMWSKLKDDPLEALQNLPSLLKLNISYDAYYGEHLHFKRGTFLKLKVLWLRGLSRLKSLVFEEGALSNVEEVIIGLSPQLKEVPSGFQHLRNLRLLEIWEMPTSFLMFQNFQSIQSIPKVRFVCKFHGTRTGFNLKSVFQIQKYVREHEEIDWNSLSIEEIIKKALLKIE